MTTEQLFKTKYITYKRMFDFENGTQYGKQHFDMQKINKTIYKMNAYDTQNEIATTLHETESTSHESTSIEIERIETNNGQQRDIIGNYNDNRVMIKKTLNHLNAMKRAMTLSQSDDEITKLRNENIMYRELLNLELSIRTMNKNIYIENNDK